jgi:hypothetical protein
MDANDPGPDVPVSPPSAAPPRVEVAVIRSGGFAGLQREWRVEPDPVDVPHWTELIEKCPWDEPVDGRAPEADRFTWRIRARCEPGPTRRAELPESSLIGAWRRLVDEARAWSPPASDDVSG